ncbi:MAG: type I DNA topoisomerase [Bacilli bacterium]|nr:type I DNA topoisomerase [Bacilli bacterium]
MKLVIVESPAKCNTIKRYLGENYDVEASLGHVRDLATSGKGGLGVDVENDFKATYLVSKDKERVVRGLKEKMSKCDEVILATDPDREGEAIAWHLTQVLGLDVNKTKRLEFHEITRDSIGTAINNPRLIDMNLVSSQETRRILDRILGFKLSTLIYKKIKSRSAGRVQSATLKMIYDHELEIEKFVPEEYWNVLTEASFNNKNFKLTFVGKNGQKLDITNEKDAKEVLAGIPEELKVISVDREFKFRESKEPFTTSTLQQEAFARLKFKTKRTQLIAQQLYEGINVGDEHMGLITYMRTDSTRLSPTFIEHATAYIIEAFGKDYLGQAKKIKTIGLMQDAHEAIRPTSNHRTPDSVRQYLTPEQYNLYKLIYNRAVASLMKAKKEEVMVVTLQGGEYTFKFELTHTLFKGYEVIYSETDDVKDYSGNFPDIQVGDIFSLLSKNVEQKFTQAPAHYSEAKIVKLMEEVGIGRPSTYASTIETLRQRKYVVNQSGILTLTEQGKKTAHVLEKYFPNIVNVKYTADMEKKLDTVEAGDESRVKTLSDFYYPFVKEVEEANKIMYKDDPIQTGEICPKCGAPLVIKEGKNGQFIGCSNYPTCKYVKKEPKPEPKYTGEVCPNCGKPLVERVDKKGKVFVACSGYPKCRYIKVNETVHEQEGVTVKVCPKCGGNMIKKKGKYGYFLGCSNYPNCSYMEKIERKKRK